MGVVFASSFSGPKKVELAAPTVALSPGEVSATVVYNASSPEPARRESYAYALADKDGNLSPYSAPVTLDLPHGGGVFFNPCTFVPNNPEIFGMVWKLGSALGVTCEGGTSPLDMPWLPFKWMSLVSPYAYYDLRKTHQIAPKAGSSKILTSVPTRPVLTKYTLPGADLSVCYSWLTEQGETELSPPCLSRGPVGYPAGGVTFRRFYMPGVEVPPGAVGYRVYVQTDKGWRRTGDFPIDCMQPLLTTLTSSGLGVFSPKATLSRRQQALDAATVGDTVVMDVEEELSCPLIDRYGREGLTVTGPHGGGFMVDYKGPMGVALLMQNRRTIYRGMWLKGGCLSSSDFSGGQAFGNRYYDCLFPGGVRTLRNSALSWENHVASEQFFSGCHLWGLEVEGINAANYQFCNTHIYGKWGRDRGHYPIRIDTACPIYFDGGCYMDYGYAAVGLGRQANVTMEGVFIDNANDVVNNFPPYGCFVQGLSYYPGTITFRSGQINVRSWQGKQPYLCQGVPEKNVVLERVKTDGPFRTGEVIPVPMLSRVANAVKRVFKRKAA